MFSVMSIVGTRPELIRLSETIKKLDMYTDHCLVFTRQSYDYEMSQIFFDELGIRIPDYTLNVKADSLSKQIGNILTQCEEVMAKEKPDVVLVLGDTNSSLSAYVAKRLGIRVVHMEAGNRCFDQEVPEEINRKIIDHIADVNLCYSENARRNLLEEGLHSSRIFVMGSPLPEIYNIHMTSILKSNIQEKLELASKNYLLVSLHREENVDGIQKLHKLLSIAATIGRKYQVPIVWSVHPRLKSIYNPYQNIVMHQPFGMFDYVNLQLGALCCLSDSGTIHEDAAILGITAVNMRNSQERPETYDAGNVILAGTDECSIANAVDTAIKQAVAGVKFARPLDYRDINYSDKAVRIILSTQHTLLNQQQD